MLIHLDKEIHGGTMVVLDAQQTDQVKEVTHSSNQQPWSDVASVFKVPNPEKSSKLLTGRDPATEIGEEIETESNQQPPKPSFLSDT